MDRRRTLTVAAADRVKSECPSKFKNSVLRAFVQRAIKTSSNYELMNSEFNRIKQVLINNGYTNTEVDHEIHKQLNKHHGETETKDKQRLETESKTNKVHHLYYRNEMNSQYRTDEKILRNILTKNIRCKNGNERVQLNIFYQNRKTHQLVMKNSPNTGQSSNRTDIVYKLTCPHEDCRPRDTCYIGATTTTLSRRLTMHLQEKTGPVEHWLQTHQEKPTHKLLKHNTDIIDNSNDHYRLFIHEALHISRLKPTLNIQRQTHISLALWGV